MAVKFSQKHYIAIAQRVKQTIDQIPYLELSREAEPEVRGVMLRFAQNLCATFAMDNYKFDREKFMTACGLKENDE